MEGKVENNTILEDTDTGQMDYEYNFFNIPWDDRSRRSKIGIVSLLFAIFVTTMAIVVNNIVMFYKGHQNTSVYTSSENKCNLARFDVYRYAARIHSIASQELICLGAMVSTSSILVNAVCLKSGPIRLYLGSVTSHHCKKGFSVEVTELIAHDGAITKRLALLTTQENIIECGNVIRLGTKTIPKGSAIIIGRPFRGGRKLSYQRATLVPLNNLTHDVKSTRNLNRDNLICAKHLSECPVRAGDLIVQKDRLIGIASTTTQGENNEMACFANLSLISDELKELDADVEFD